MAKKRNTKGEEMNVNKTGQRAIIIEAYEVGFTSCAEGLYDFIDSQDIKGMREFLDDFFEKGNAGGRRVLKKDVDKLDMLVKGDKE